MPALQPHAETFNPNALDLVCVATYERLIGASMTRVWENVLDWEHLPHLHATSFDHVELIEGGQWGWRTWSDPDKRSHIELTVANDSSYVARSYQAGEQVSEIWTELSPKDNGVAIKVSFYLPDVPEEEKDKLGRLMLALYTRLWDEDEQMMIEREQRLTETRDDHAEVNLGDIDTLRTRLANDEAITFELGKRAFRLRETGGEFIAHQNICPHLLGPLDGFDADTGTVTCPWHGYRFDLADGHCISPASATCRLGPSPAISLEGDNLIARTR